MPTSDIYAKLKDLIVEQLNVVPEKVTLNASFTKDLGADSLDIIELLMAAEEEFGLDIENEDVTKIETIKDAVEYLEKHLT